MTVIKSNGVHRNFMYYYYTLADKVVSTWLWFGAQQFGTIVEVSLSKSIYKYIHHSM